MPIDPRISLGVQPLQVADPMARYSQLAGIQNAQNQNALAQYQLSTAQREQESVNALNQAYASAYDPATGKELWRLEERAQHSASERPLFWRGVAFFQSGFKNRIIQT